MIKIELSKQKRKKKKKKRNLILKIKKIPRKVQVQQSIVLSRFNQTRVDKEINKQKPREKPEKLFSGPNNWFLIYFILRLKDSIELLLKYGQRTVGKKNAGKGGGDKRALLKTSISGLSPKDSKEWNYHSFVFSHKINFFFRKYSR